MITNISRITIYVEKQADAKQFWVEKMGFHVVFEQSMGESSWLEVAPMHGETRFVLYDKALMKQQNPKANVEHPSLILSCLHLDKTHDTLKQNGVNINDIMTFPYGKMCTFYDPDGNTYMLREDSLK